MIVWRISQSAGASAIYSTTDPTDTAPLTAPLSNLSRVYWHSSFDYVGVKSIHTGSVILGAIAAPAITSTTHTLFAHGQAGTPGVFGVALNLAGSGVDVPLIGSVIIQLDASSGFCRSINLFADATNVYLVDWGATITAGGYSSMAINYKIYMTDKLF